MTELSIQIRFADIDMLGHVNNVNLQHFFDLGKTDYTHKILNINPISWTKESLIQVHTTTNYYKETLYGDDIYVTTKVESIGTKSISFYQEIIDSKNGVVKAVSSSVMVAFDFEQHRSIEVPEKWRLAAAAEDNL